MYDPGRYARCLRTAVVAAFWNAGCAGNDASRAASDPTLPLPATASRRETLPSDVSTPRGDARKSGSTPTVAITDPAVLNALERAGFTPARLLEGVEATTTSELNRQPGVKSIFDVVRKDVIATNVADRRAKVTSVDGFRLFDARWLDSKEMSLRLIGVFNRLDRRAFQRGTCGEIRFLYRLGYDVRQGGEPMASRLPMTVNVVYLVGADGDRDCRAAAGAWFAPGDLAGTAAARWFAQGPLAKPLQQRWRLKSVETNLQTLRLQSSVHPSLAGHIEYKMRVFRPHEAGPPGRPSPGGFAPGPMENMPDVTALARNRALRAELLALLREPATLKALDSGTLNLPERFLATLAISVSPRGLTRPANRPFRQLFEPSDFGDLDLGAYRTLRSTTGLLRRLDGASCSGCHQSRSIAGFHHAGMNPPESPPFNSLHDGSSSHLRADLERRRAYVAAVARGEAPDEFRPIPERQGVGNGYGAPCGLGDPGLADWSCAPGLRCEKLEDPEVGACFAEPAIGSPCEYGQVLPSSAPGRDRVGGMSQHSCGEERSCDKNISGFPLGTCASACSNEPGSVCGDFLDVDGFQACLRARRSYMECAQKHVFESGLRSCDETHPCRQDYVCARTSRDAAGACIPPYFIYQLRLDGYPLRQ